MNTFAEFLRSRLGLGTLAIALILLVAVLFSSCGSGQAPRVLPPATNSTDASSLKRDIGSIPALKPPPVFATNPPKPSVILSIDVPLSAETNLVPGMFAPAGSQLICQLVNTVESIRIETPVIGLVIRDLTVAQQVIVPAGTRVLGKAQVDRVRDRLSANGSWTLVFPDGKELLVDGLALHREEIVPGEKWGLEDGSAGFKGQVVKSSSLDEIKLFAAAFLSGVSKGFQETDASIYGPRVRRSMQNAALAGSSAVLDDYARSIAESIKRDGIFVRVPGGAEFTLYLPNFLDRSAARVGATRRTNSKL